MWRRLSVLSTLPLLLYFFFFGGGSNLLWMFSRGIGIAVLPVVRVLAGPLRSLEPLVALDSSCFAWLL